MMDARTRIHSTLKICPWAPITSDRNVRDKDRRTMLQLKGIRLKKMKHIILKSDRASG